MSMYSLFHTVFHLLQSGWYGIDRDTGTRYLTPQPRLFAGRLRGWRRSRAASGELAPKNSLEVPDERLIAERAAGGLGSPERGGGGRRLGVGQKGRDVADPVQQRPCHDQPVIFARQMRPGARPGPVLGPRDQACAHRVHRHIAGGGDQVGLVHDYRGKSVLEQMPGPAAARIDEVGVAPMRLAHGQAKSGIVSWREDQVDVIGHQAIGPDLNAAPADLFGEQVTINLLVAVLEEDRLAPIAPLGHMVRQSGNDHAGEASHPRPIA